MKVWTAIGIAAFLTAFAIVGDAATGRGLGFCLILGLLVVFAAAWWRLLSERRRARHR